jgi:hypothetical protein
MVRAYMPTSGPADQPLESTEAPKRRTSTVTVGVFV